MSDIKMEDLVEKEVETTPDPQPEEKVEEAPEAEPTEQDPLKLELERVNKKDPAKELEKATKALYFNAKRLKELGGNPNTILGIEDEAPNPEEDDDQPFTVGMYKKLQQEQASKSAMQLSEEIQNETERELVRYHLENSIKSSGNATEDLRLARSIVNATKNSQIIEESNRKATAKTHSSASSAPAKEVKVQGELTPAEKIFLGKPFNMSADQIIKLRQK